MTRKTWLAALAGAGVLVAGSLTASNAQAGTSASAAAQSLGSYTAAGDLISAKSPVRRTALHHRGRGHDGHGGEHSGGGAQRSSKKSAPVKSTKNKKPSNNYGKNGGDASKKSNNRGRHHHGGGHHHHGGGCHYPPSSSPQVTLSGPNHTHQGRTVTLTGKVSLNGCQMSQVKLGLYSSHDGTANWVMIRAGQVDNGGNFTFTVPSWATHYYQAVAAAGDGYSPSSSNILPLHLR